MSFPGSPGRSPHTQPASRWGASWGCADVYGCRPCPVYDHIWANCFPLLIFLLVVFLCVLIVTKFLTPTHLTCSKLRDAPVGSHKIFIYLSFFTSFVPIFEGAICFFIRCISFTPQKGGSSPQHVDTWLTRGIRHHVCLHDTALHEHGQCCPKRF